MSDIKQSNNWAELEPPDFNPGQMVWIRRIGTRYVKEPWESIDTMFTSFISLNPELKKFVGYPALIVDGKMRGTLSFRQGAYADRDVNLKYYASVLLPNGKVINLHKSFLSIAAF